jgi:hypothetical protein
VKFQRGAFTDNWHHKIRIEDKKIHFCTQRLISKDFIVKIDALRKNLLSRSLVFRRFFEVAKRGKSSYEMLH